MTVTIRHPISSDLSGYIIPTSIAEKIINTWNLILSATAPDTIVAAVPANTNWKRNLAQKGTCVQLIESKPSSTPKLAKNRLVRPEKPFPFENISPHPINQNPTDARANTIKFFARIFTVFFARQRPDSTIANPRFIKNTRNAASRTQTVSSPIDNVLINVAVSVVS